MNTRDLEKLILDWDASGEPTNKYLKIDIIEGVKHLINDYRSLKTEHDILSEKYLKLKAVIE